jgi:hypothetical protein
MHSNIILPFTPRSSKWSLPFSLSDWNFCMHFSFPLYTHRITHPSYPQSDHSNSIGWNAIKIKTCVVNFLKYGKYLNWNITSWWMVMNLAYSSASPSCIPCCFTWFIATKLFFVNHSCKELQKIQSFPNEYVKYLQSYCTLLYFSVNNTLIQIPRYAYVC